ncbi:MAG: PilW family protein [Burkholderiaceae bacterium]|nr:PilW family protein [Burkholderiaceae bacterium]
MRRVPHALLRRPALAGVSLIELMVGLAIGLLATLVITQVLRLYESQKRNTTAGADAQINGAVALHTLQRELQQGGWGLSSGAAAGCPMRYKLRAEPVAEQVTAAVQITDGTDGAPDELLVQRAGGKGFAVPLKIKGHFRNAVAFDLDGATNLDIRQGDLMLAVPRTLTPGSNWCVLFNISAPPDPANMEVLAHASDANGPWNHDGNVNPDLGSGLALYPGLTASTVAFEAGSHIVDIGQLVMTRYRLQGQQLQTQQRRFAATSTSTAWPADWTELQPHIVDLQAVYGKDDSTPRDQIADRWDAVAPASADAWARVVAVRVALVARSTHYEKEPVTRDRPDAEACAQGPSAAGNYPVWSPAGDGRWACLTVDGLTDWQHYRYKVFETVVPLRNMLWQS